MLDVRSFSEEINSTKIKTLRQIQMSMDLSWVKKKNYKIINTIEGVEEVSNELRKAGFFAFDTETTGLNIYNMSRTNPNKDFVVGLCISWKEDQGVYIPLKHTKFMNAPIVETFKILQPMLETIPCVTHNGLFDGKVMYDNGIKLNIQHDTMHLLFAIDSDIAHFPRGLKHLTEYLFGYTPIEFEDIFEYEKDYRLFRYVDEDVARIYACADADDTLKCFNKLISYLQKIHYKSYKKHIQLIPHIIRSEYEGKTIDLNLLKTKSDINKADLIKVENIIYKYVGAELSYVQTGSIGNKIYKFNINSLPELSRLLFTKLGYPRKEGHGIDKRVLVWWSTLPIDSKDSIVVPATLFTEDITSTDGKTVLLTKEVLINCKCRIALLIQLYRKLAKNQSSFFDPILSGVTDGKYFTSINLCRAATYRMIDLIQTLDGNLKAVVAPPDNCYQIGYDYSQIEARCMIGLSGHKEYVEMLDNPEADYHTIAAAIIEGIKPIFVTKKQRKKYKPVNFGLPYGIGAKSMMEQGRGIGLSEEEYKKAIAETEDAIAKWKVGMKPIWDMLEDARDQALTPLKYEEDKPFYWRGKTVGRVTSPFGRARYFLLENLTQSVIASVRRKAGNFPIQSFAFDIYIEGVIKLGNTLVNEGLMDIKVEDDYSPLGYHFENKVVFREYVHDEVQMTIDKSINPKWMMKKIMDNCIIHIEGHPTYYIGCSVVKNWGESKAGDHEVPFAWMESLPDNLSKFGGYTDTVQEDFDNECAVFIKQRTVEEFAKLGKDIWTLESMTIDELYEFESYYLIGKMCDYYKKGRRPVNKKASYNDEFIASLELAFNHEIKITDSVEIISNNDSLVNDNQEDKIYLSWEELWSDLADDDNDYDLSIDSDDKKTEFSADKESEFTINLENNLSFLSSLVNN